MKKLQLSSPIYENEWEKIVQTLKMLLKGEINYSEIKKESGEVMKTLELCSVIWKMGKKAAI